MIQEADSKKLMLPDRKEITLCEAVTAFVYGKASDVEEQMLNGEPQTEEQSARAKDLIERLQGAAYAGTIKFRCLKNGDDHVDGHKVVDHLYFSERRGFCWYRDQIWNHDLSHYRPKFKSQPNFTMDWHDVHLDREQFELWLDASAGQNPIAVAPGDIETSRTGTAGRPTSIHLVLDIARSRIAARHYPPTFAAFVEQLAEELANTYPYAHRVKPKTLRNNPVLSELWRKRPKINDPS